MKFVYFVLISFLASTTTAASLRSLPERKEFAFEYDSESEDNPQSEEVSKSVPPLVSNLCQFFTLLKHHILRSFQGSIRKPNVGLTAELRRPEAYAWSQLDKVVRTLALHLHSNTVQSEEKLVQGVSGSINQDKRGIQIVSHIYTDSKS